MNYRCAVQSEELLRIHDNVRLKTLRVSEMSNLK